MAVKGKSHSRKIPFVPFLPLSSQMSWLDCRRHLGPLGNKDRARRGREESWHAEDPGGVLNEESGSEPISWPSKQTFTPSLLVRGDQNFLHCSPPLDFLPLTWKCSCLQSNVGGEGYDSSSERCLSHTPAALSIMHFYCGYFPVILSHPGHLCGSFYFRGGAVTPPQETSHLLRDPTYNSPSSMFIKNWP